MTKSGGSRWSPWRFNAEVQEAEEDAAVEAEPAGSQHATRSQADPRPQTYESTETCLHTRIRWSEVPCTFDREDHPAIVPKECYALVVSPRIDGYDFSKCLMDGGASLNIMYLETLERMNLTKEQLKHSNTEFHGVVPEKITFEVVPFKSSYHVIFGRPTYHKFHARACYIYNKLKIPGPKETKKHDLIKGDPSKQVPPTNVRCAVLKDQIGRNVHAYVDDIAVMTRKGSDLISDLTKPSTTSGYKMTLNLLNRNRNARNSVMAAYRDEVDEIAKCFLGYEVKYVRRDDNTAADMLSKLGSGRKQIPPI
ncbi:hypothetical protein QYE76_035632 [Lolium multiflorum]|uniref:RNase H type-1 domain-containing protein n=1 Tax=Lolium multiflorum TaxID=4521 RepID=A0AAD8VME1_LOLMU|nr:hypothetical protein QYE76_035632 [Lolium multiflorum]